MCNFPPLLPSSSPSPQPSPFPNLQPHIHMYGCLHILMICIFEGRPSNDQSFQHAWQSILAVKLSMAWQLQFGQPPAPAQRLAQRLLVNIIYRRNESRNRQKSSIMIVSVDLKNKLKYFAHTLFLFSLLPLQSYIPVHHYQLGSLVIQLQYFSCDPYPPFTFLLQILDPEIASTVPSSPLPPPHTHTLKQISTSIKENLYFLMAVQKINSTQTRVAGIK